MRRNKAVFDGYFWLVIAEIPIEGGDGVEAVFVVNGRETGGVITQAPCVGLNKECKRRKRENKGDFYLKREGNTERTETNLDAVFPIIGKIIIGNTIAQFGSKLKIEERLWSVKSGRAIGKSRVVVELNKEINKIIMLMPLK